MEFLSSLVLTVALTGSISPYHYMIAFENDLITGTTYNVYTDIELSYYDRLFFVGYSTDTESKKSIEWYFEPLTDKYEVYAGISKGPFELRISHYCLHPIDNMTKGVIDSLSLSESQDTVSFTYKQSFNIFK